LLFIDWRKASAFCRIMLDRRTTGLNRGVHDAHDLMRALHIALGSLLYS
jgi:hypothetical protein